jgi:hypothetical protein
MIDLPPPRVLWTIRHAGVLALGSLIRLSAHEQTSELASHGS